MREIAARAVGAFLGMLLGMMFWMGLLFLAGWLGWIS